MRIINLYQSLYIVAVIDMKRKVTFFILLFAYVFAVVNYPIIAILIGAAIVLCLFLNRYAKQSKWWESKFISNDNFLPQPLFRADFRRNFDMINLGSSESFYNFKYKTVYGLNLSTGLQSFRIDKKIIKFYHSYLRKGGLVAIPISPYKYEYKENFKYYGGLFINLKEEDRTRYGDYYSKRLPILDYQDYPQKKLISLYHKIPIVFGLFSYIKVILSRGEDLQIKKRKLFRKCLTSSENAEINDIIEFCIEREYRPFIIILPALISDRKDIIADFDENIRKEYSKKVPILNYLLKPEWNNKSLYTDQSCLRPEISEEFTTAVFQDISAEYERFK